ncbi:hypothetical protein XELAEV_18034862mg [Xenopus laevis]|uniref:Uncharacterized protein n=1 Tax=Xenopus laevis TaxID=8355 RepID=A0A974HBM2_XENLA|nr:hypothetical protein XELAEV_18034862mg [Xenopus laevis]
MTSEAIVWTCLTETGNKLISSACYYPFLPWIMYLYLHMLMFNNGCFTSILCLFHVIATHRGCISTTYRIHRC